MKGFHYNRPTHDLIPHFEVAFPGIAAQLAKPDGISDQLLQEIRQLLDSYVASWPFAEEQYLQMYPEIEAEVRNGKFNSGREHFRQIGYLQGRLPARPALIPTGTSRPIRTFGSPFNGIRP